MRELSYCARKVGADLVQAFAALNIEAQVRGAPKRWFRGERIVTIFNGRATSWSLSQAEALLEGLRFARRLALLRAAWDREPAADQ